MEAWLSWLEHTVHIREVTGSSPVASTNIKTLLNSRVFLLLLVSATGSKVRSAPHTLCVLCPTVTLHAPLSNASISAPLMSESCPSTTLYQSAPVADWFLIFLKFFSQNINDFIILQRKGTIIPLFIWILLFCLFLYCSVGTSNRAISRDALIPIIAFCDCIPLFFCAFKNDVCKPSATIEGTVTYTCYAVRNCYTYQITAAPEGTFA